LIRPVGNSSDRLTVKMGLKLSQIIGVDMKRQIMITNVWVEQVMACLFDISSTLGLNFGS
jgi:hypothetical protein